MKNNKPRKLVTHIPALSLLALALLVGSVHAEDIGERTNQGTAMLASLQSERDSSTSTPAAGWMNNRQPRR